MVEILALDASLLNGLGRQRRFAFDSHLSKVVLTEDTRAAVAALEPSARMAALETRFTRMAGLEIALEIRLAQSALSAAPAFCLCGD